MKAKEKNVDKIRRHNKRWMAIIRFILSPSTLKKFEIPPERSRLPEGGNLILANHVTLADQFFIGVYFENQMLYYVAGENVFSNKLFRWFAEKTIGVIIHMRGVSSINTIKEMTKVIKRGDNVLIFPEGTTTFDGRTEEIDASIAKVAKVSCGNLVLVRIEGGYFARPRWGHTVRKGKMKFIEQVYTKEQLGKMSPAEIKDAINGHLYTDAYAEQEKDPAEHIGKDPCHGLESCIYRCPKCNHFTKLKTNANSIYCDCGFEATYDTFGYLTDKEGAKHTITKWCNDQKTLLKEKVEKTKQTGESELLFTEAVEVKKLYASGKRKKQGEFTIKVYTDHLEYENLRNENVKGTITLTDVEYAFIFQRNTLNIRIKGREYGYEIKGDFSFNALKYRDLYDIINL